MGAWSWIANDGHSDWIPLSLLDCSDRFSYPKIFGYRSDSRGRLNYSYLPSPATQWTATQHPGSSLKRAFSRLNHSSMTSIGGGVPSSNCQSCGGRTIILLQKLWKLAILHQFLTMSKSRHFLSCLLHLTRRSNIQHSIANIYMYRKAVWQVFQDWEFSLLYCNQAFLSFWHRCFDTCYFFVIFIIFVQHWIIDWFHSAKLLLVSTLKNIKFSKFNGQNLL